MPLFVHFLLWLVIRPMPCLMLLTSLFLFICFLLLRSIVCLLGCMDFCFSYPEVKTLMSLILLQNLHLEKRKKREWEREGRKGNVQHWVVCIINKKQHFIWNFKVWWAAQDGPWSALLVWWSVEVAHFTCSCSVTAPLEKQITLCMHVCLCACLSSTLTMVLATMTRNCMTQAFY